MTGTICDIVIIAVFIIVFFSIAKKGFVKSVYKLFSLAITVFLVYTLSAPAAELVKDTALYRSVSENITESIVNNSGAAELKLPAYITGGADIGEMIHNSAEASAEAITGTAAKIVAVVALFIIIKILLFVLFILLCAIVKLPVLHGLNKLLGVVSALLHAFAAVYILCAIVSIPADALIPVQNAIADSYIAEYLYNNNFLMQMFI